MGRRSPPPATPRRVARGLTRLRRGAVALALLTAVGCGDGTRPVAEGPPPRQGVVGISAAGEVLFDRVLGAGGPTNPAGSAFVSVVATSDRYVGLDPTTGAERWTARGGRFPALVAGGTVLVDRGSNAVDALDAVTGRVRWTTAGMNVLTADADVAIASYRPRLGAGVVLPPGTTPEQSGEQTVALDLRNGATMWQAPAPRGMQAPRLVVDALVTCDADGLVRALARADGAERWRVPLGENAGGVVVATTDVVGLEAAGRLVVLDLATGRRLWTATLPDDSSGPTTTAALGGLIVVTGSAGTTAFRSRTGERAWDTDVAGSEVLVLADPPTVVVLDGTRRTVIGLDPRAGSRRWTRELSAPGLDAVVGPATPLDGGPLLLTTGYDVPRHRD